MPSPSRQLTSTQQLPCKAVCRSPTAPGLSHLNSVQRSVLPEPKCLSQPGTQEPSFLSRHLWRETQALPCLSLHQENKSKQYQVNSAMAGAMLAPEQDAEAGGASGGPAGQWLHLAGDDGDRGWGG